MAVPQGGPSLIRNGMPGQGPPRSRRQALILLLVRLGTGLAAIGIAVLNGIGQASVVEHAADWSLPAPAIAVRLGLLLLLLAGIVLVAGIASRLAALVILVVDLVMVATAGRVDGGLALFGGAALAVGCLVIVARGGGARQLLDRIDPA